MTKKHALIMVACCLIPIVAFALISVFKIPVSGLLSIGLILLCPISHLVMMKFMGSEHEGNHSETQKPVGIDKVIDHPASHMKH